MSVLWKFRAFCLVFFKIFLLVSLSTHAQSSGNNAPELGISEEEVIAKCNKSAESHATERLDAKSMASLPVAILNNPAVIIAVDSTYSTEQGWFFSAYASVMLPGSMTPLAFAARNIGFNGKGLSATSEMRLTLVSKKHIKINEHVRLELARDGSNYIEFNCDGFRTINLKGDFIFNEGLIQPDPELAKGQKVVKGTFEVNSKDLNNILMAVSITPFNIRGVKELSFEVKNAVADFSDIVNPPGFSFPSEYQQTFGSDITLWRGFYLKEVDVRLKKMADDPKKFPTISAHNLIIDDLGVSGTFGASNLLSLQDGSADGWPISIDALSIKLLFNRLAGASLGGLLNVPFLGDDPLPYTATMEQVDSVMNYYFAVTTTEGKEYNTPFAAKVTIDKGSVIGLENKGGRFIGHAKLQGMLTLKHKVANFKNIKFQDLQLKTQKPYLISGIFSTVGEEKSEGVGFPLSIDSIYMRVYQGEAAINVATSLNLMDGKGFSASTTVQLLAKVEVEETPIASSGEIPRTSKRQRWKLEKVKINDINISSDCNALYLKGMLSVYDNDPVYGTGFGGSLAFRINKIMKNNVKVTAYFGSMPTYRYWHLDAYVPTTIPLGPVVTIKGLMGGASYHMTRKQPFQPDFNKLDPNKMMENGPTDGSTYVPDDKTGVAFLAGITLIISNDAVVNGDALFEIAFNPHGGLRYVQFTGSAFFFSPISSRSRTVGNNVPKAPVFASLNMLYDNDNNVFHANLKTYLDVAGILKGSGPNNLVGEAVIHTDPKDWYIYIGRPSQMFGVSLLGVVKAQTYFMVGTQVEDIPPPPEEVREIFDDIDPGLMRDGSSLGSGRGFATGAHFRIGFDKRIKPFYVVVKIGAGADIMLRNYGDAHCEGRSGKVGIDGWYASGQAYVFLMGKVGIRVKGSDFDIVSVGAAALLQAKLPNPTWLKGQLGGKYKILGGLIKGKFKIKMVVGEECEIVQEGNELDNIKVIADVKPDDNGENVNVFTAPQASFNTSLETEFSMMDAKDNLNYYRIKLAEFTVTKDGVPLQAEIEWNATKDVAMLRTHEILPPQSKLKATVKLYWEKKPGSSGSWAVIKKDGQTAYEIREHFFTTGTAPDFIPDENVLYSYPVKHQYNLYPNETNGGYVQLRMGQAYLFEPSPDGKQYEFIAKFQSVQGQTVEVPLTYNASKKNASFEIPSTLSRQSIYKFFFVKRPAGGGAIDQNLQRNEVQVDAGEGNEMALASNNLQGTITNTVEKDLYTSAFRTSQYGKFAEKIETLSNQRDLFDIAIGNVGVIGKRGDISETFDAIELKGKEGEIEPLVKVIALPDNPWLTQHMSPLIYDNYPIANDIALSWRDPAILGVKPLKGVRLTNDQGDYILTDNNVTAGTAPTKGGSIVVGYYLSYYALKDFSDLRSQTAGKYLSNWSSAPPAAKKLLSVTGYIDLIEGQYPVEISYFLPGSPEPTYRKQISIKF